MVLSSVVLMGYGYALVKMRRKWGNVTREFLRGNEMYYCVASIRRMSGSNTNEFMRLTKGNTKGEALKELFTSGGVIFWFEELSQEDYEILHDAINKGEFAK